MNLPRTVLPAIVLLFACGCQWNQPKSSKNYETIIADPGRDTERARRHNARAIELLDGGDLAGAEGELKASLAADTMFGPAHSNLGVVYFRQKKLYEAALEFQHAAKVMPGEIEPRNNLGLVLEATGKLDDATKWYEEALTIDPNAFEVVANLARVCIQMNRKDERTRELLRDIVLKDKRPDWVSWAKERLALMGPPRETATKPSRQD
jgi:Tfp pilus assembly protein PilF